MELIPSDYVVDNHLSRPAYLLSNADKKIKLAADIYQAGKDVADALGFGRGTVTGLYNTAKGYFQGRPSQPHAVYPLFRRRRPYIYKRHYYRRYRRRRYYY